MVNKERAGKTTSMDHQYYPPCMTSTSLTPKKLSYGPPRASSVMPFTADCAKGLVASNCDVPVSRARNGM
jgi:hypothetical protein